jgi:hypothetical protein
MTASLSSTPAALPAASEIAVAAIMPHGIVSIKQPWRTNRHGFFR